MLCNSTKEFPGKSVFSQFINHAKFKTQIPEVSSNLTILYGEGYINLLIWKFKRNMFESKDYGCMIMTR